MTLLADPGGSFRQVLVVDDEGALQMLVRAVLEQERFMVDIARDGMEACVQVRRQHYDAIVCDLRMPKMDGATFYGILKDTDASQAGRVIFVTGADIDADTGQKVLGRPILRKPFDIDELERIVARVACQAA
jgi:CheY-like chemotaxis protein